MMRRPLAALAFVALASACNSSSSSGPPTGPSLGPPGCFSGTPTTYPELMNACTAAEYVVVDNCALLGYCEGGTLPARVPPPRDAGAD
jgi:hypothetical protein